jgi:HSP20 family protein
MAMLLPDPFDALLQFQLALDSFRTSGWLGAGPSSGGAYPPLNVFRKGDDIVVICEVPGVRKEDLQIEIKGKTIRIAGSKSVQYGERVGVHRRERRAGTFDRAVTLPVEIDADGVKAECRDGILALYLPRAERDKPKSIAVS